jgi:hypothetical protein
MKRAVREQAEEWRRERLAALKAEIRIDESVLRLLYDELDEIDRLQGDDLAYRFLWESQAEVAKTMEPQKCYEEAIQDIFFEAARKGTLWRIFDVPRDFLTR